MDDKLGEEIRLSLGRQDCMYELFHENSKLTRYTASISDQAVIKSLEQHEESLPFIGYPIVQLSKNFTPSELSLRDLLFARASVREFSAGPIL